MGQEYALDVIKCKIECQLRANNHKQWQYTVPKWSGWQLNQINLNAKNMKTPKLVNETKEWERERDEGKEKTQPGPDGDGGDGVRARQQREEKRREEKLGV